MFHKIRFVLVKTNIKGWKHRNKCCSRIFILSITMTIIWDEESRNFLDYNNYGSVIKTKIDASRFKIFMGIIICVGYWSTTDVNDFTFVSNSTMQMTLVQFASKSVASDPKSTHIRVQQPMQIDPPFELVLGWDIEYGTSGNFSSYSLLLFARGVQYGSGTKKMHRNQTKPF